MSRIGRNDACPCGSNKKYKKCCEATGAYEPAPQISAEQPRKPEDFGMVIALRPRKKFQISPAQKIKRTTRSRHYKSPDDLLAQAFMATLALVLNACHQAGDAYKKATGHDIFLDFCKLIHVAENNLPEDVLKTTLSPFAYLRHATYHPAARAFFDDHIARTLQQTPEAIDLYNQLTDKPFDVWEFSPTEDPTYTTRVAFTNPATHKSREIDGMFCLSENIPTIYHLAALLPWRGYEFLLSLGAFEPVAIAKQHTVVDIKNPAASTPVPFYYNEHTAIKHLADPHALYAPAPLTPQSSPPPDQPEPPNAFTSIFK